MVCGNFNPRTPRGVRLGPGAIVRPGSLDISIHAPREGCDSSPSSVDRWNEISIHAPREGCDRPCCTSETGRRYFNPRTPRGVRRRYFPSPSAEGRFQSTHPARGATPACPVEAQGVESFQSTHPARGATICHWSTDNLDITISIHAPREGCDSPQMHAGPPLLAISIHAPREGCDLLPDPARYRRRISIHAPREGCDVVLKLLPTWMQEISIHAPREGCDLGGFTTGLECGNFNPRTPRGVRLPRFGAANPLNYFNPRTPRGVRPPHGRHTCGGCVISIHAPREGCDSKLYQRAESLLGSICLFAQGEEG